MADGDEVSNFFRTVETVFRDIDRKVQAGFASDADLNASVMLLQQIRYWIPSSYRALQDLRAFLCFVPYVFDTVVKPLNELFIQRLFSWCKYQNRTNLLRMRGSVQQNEYTVLLETLDTLVTRLPGLRAQTEGAATVQGPKRYLSKDETGERLQHLLRSGFSVTYIAKKGLLGNTIHRNTVYYHMKRHGLQSSKRTYYMANEHVQEIVSGYINTHPNAGSEEIRAYLTTRDPPIHIPRDRVRAMVAELDPVGVAVRWTNVIQRRQYSVEGPNSLWHIDGHHKLVRYKLYIHGGIDGYSRLIPYIRASCHNTARVAFASFVYGVARFSIPSRVRLDQGVENGLISEFMNAANGPNRGSAIHGQSVHNQRIERLWRDVRTKVVSIFTNILWALEESGALNIENNVQLFCAQFVFLPALNRALEEWRKTHNSHKVRTMGHQTPQQLWESGLVEQMERETTAVRNVRIDRDIQQLCDQVLPGFDLNEVVDEEKFNTPTACNQVSEDIMIQLKNRFGSQGVKIDECIDCYGEVLTYLSELISANA